MESPADAGTLLAHLAVLSLVSVGGAHAVFPDVFRLVVTERDWMTGTEFATLVARRASVAATRNAMLTHRRPHPRRSATTGAGA